MKSLTTLLLILTLAVSCADQDSPERSDLGCMTAAGATIPITNGKQ